MPAERHKLIGLQPITRTKDSEVQGEQDAVKKHLPQQRPSAAHLAPKGQLSIGQIPYGNDEENGHGDAPRGIQHPIADHAREGPRKRRNGLGVVNEEVVRDYKPHRDDAKEFDF